MCYFITSEPTNTSPASQRIFENIWGQYIDEQTFGKRALPSVGKAKSLLRSPTQASLSLYWESLASLPVPCTAYVLVVLTHVLLNIFVVNTFGKPVSDRIESWVSENSYSTQKIFQVYSLLFGVSSSLFDSSYWLQWEFENLPTTARGMEDNKGVRTVQSVPVGSEDSINSASYTHNFWK